jgi:HAE1 family hydrophobic/amphiphilic exporter-1
MWTVRCGQANRKYILISIGLDQRTLNTLVAGQTASTFNAGDDQYDVVVRAEDRFRGSLEGLEMMTVASTKIGSVDLNKVVSSRTSTGPSSISRLNRQRIVEITGNLLLGGSQSVAVRGFDRLIDELNMGPDYRGGATGMTGEMSNVFYYFGIAFALAFIFMYIALASQFESFIHPVTILITLPLAVPFGIFSMLITGQSISVFSGLGLLLLFGIVKKNAILQIDRMNGLRAAGMNRYEAIIQANRDRLRPILMTTMALVCGMIPLLLSQGAGAATNHSIGFMVAGGQTLCLVLTLLAVPVFYSLWEDLVNWLRSGWLSQWKAKQVAKAAAILSLLTVIVSVSYAQAPMAGRTVNTPQSVNLQPLDEFEIAPRIGIKGKTNLSLKDAIEKVLANDPELAVSRIAVEIAKYGVQGSEGYFSPVFTLDTYKSRSATPIASIIGGSESGKLTSTELTFTPKITGFSSWRGTSYSLAFSDSKQSNDSSFTTLNPQYPSSLTLSFTQPLWRNLRIDAGRHSLLVARKNRKLSNEQFRQTVIERVTLAVQYYWELVYAWQSLEVQKHALDLAMQQYESNRRQVEQGLLAQIEIVAAQTQVATYRQSVVAAQQTLTISENNLKQMMMSGRDDPMWDDALIPETQFSLDFSAPALADALSQALDNRPELAESSLNMDISRLDALYYKDQKRPKIDLYASLTATGLAGTPQTATPFGDFPIGSVPGLLTGANLQSLHNLWARNFPTVKVGVQISFPFSNRTAEANAAMALAEGRRLQLARKQLEMYVEADVRNALEQLNSARARFNAAEIAANAALEQYKSEQRQFQEGTSSMFLILERQTSYIVARSNEVRAHADLAEAMANLDRALARTLETHQIKLNP